MPSRLASTGRFTVFLGFAVGCEAVALPRRHSQITAGLCPQCGLGPSDLLDQRPNRGHSPKRKGHLYARHSHRLTPGGKAEPVTTEDF